MKHGFTLIELIVVIIIVGILAAVGMTQYSSIVEKSRTAEARVRIGTMRQLTQEYYLNKGSVADITNAEVGADYACGSSSFYRYAIWPVNATRVGLYAYRCITGSGGKSPNASRGYMYYLDFWLDTGRSTWYCQYTDDLSHCFGL